MIGASCTPKRSNNARHCATRTAGTTSVNGSRRARATASATYDLPKPTSSASSAPPWRAMIAVSRSAAGTWCGASQAGQTVAVGATACPSSSARAALATTLRGGASPASPAFPALPGARATVSGSATGTSCSERIRGQRAAVGGIELEGLGNEFVGGLTTLAAARELRPDRGVVCRNGETADHSRIEAAEPTARRIRNQASERREPAGIEQRGERGSVGRVARGNAINGVERHQLRRRHGGGETPAQVGPYDAMRRESEAGPEQLPGR